MSWKVILKADRQLIDMEYISEVFGNYITHHVASTLGARLSLYGRTNGPLIVRETDDSYADTFRDEQLQSILNDFTLEISSYGDAKIDNKSFSGSFEGKFVLGDRSSPVLEKHHELIEKIPFDVTYSGEWAKPYQVAKLSKNQGVRNFKIQTSNMLEGLQKVAAISIKDTEEDGSFEIEVSDNARRTYSSLKFGFNSFRDMMRSFEFGEDEVVLGDLRGGAHNDPNFGRGREDKRYFPTDYSPLMQDKDRATDKSKGQAWRSVLYSGKKGDTEKRYKQYIEILGGRPPSVRELAVMQSGERTPTLEDVYIDDEVLTEEQFDKVLAKVGITKQDLKTYKLYEGGEAFELNLLLDMGFGEIYAYISDEGGEIMVEGNFTPIPLNEYLELDDSEYRKVNEKLKDIKQILPSSKGNGFMKLLRMANSVKELKRE